MADAQNAAKSEVNREIVVSKAFSLMHQQPTDVILFCEDGEMRSHKVILSAVSPYFEVFVILGLKS